MYLPTYPIYFIYCIQKYSYMLIAHARAGLENTREFLYSSQITTPQQAPHKKRMWIKLALKKLNRHRNIEFLKK